MGYLSFRYAGNTWQLDGWGLKDQLQIYSSNFGSIESDGTLGLRSIFMLKELTKRENLLLQEKK